MEETMSNQEFGRDSSPMAASETESTSRPGEKNQNIRDAANQAFSRASDMARDATEQAKHAASATASSVTHNVKDLRNRQIDTGAGLAGHFANSVRLAADDLARESPIAADLVRSFATKVDGYAEGLQDQTVDQLARAASDYTRRQPALVFGLAALAGFFAFRVMKSGQSVASPPIQPGQQGAHSGF
jgi:ElaB/YqjD/DUF883 family membrane-anchored ribosome-binding protein